MFFRNILTKRKFSIEAFSSETFSEEFKSPFFCLLFQSLFFKLFQFWKTLDAVVKAVVSRRRHLEIYGVECRRNKNGFASRRFLPTRKILLPKSKTLISKLSFMQKAAKLYIHVSSQTTNFGEMRNWISERF